MSDVQQMNLQAKTVQNLSQVQVQRMSQSQIMSLNVLAMSAADLRGAIYEHAAKNPALEIVSDKLEKGVEKTQETIPFSDNIQYKSTDFSGDVARDNFQKALESNADFREPLSEHLEHQLNAMNLSESERSLCRRLIFNLDSRGFHILAPASFLDREDKNQTEAFLQHCLEIVQKLDPEGTCTKNFEESLFVQAKLNGTATPLTLFILDGHFDFLNPPNVAKIKKKLADFFQEQKKRKFSTAEEIDFTEQDIAESLEFIKKLDPFPARNFGTSGTQFVAPDVIVERIAFADDGTEKTAAHEFSVSLATDFLPRLEVSKSYLSLIENAKNAANGTDEKAERKKAELNFAKASVGDAKLFIESIQYRKSTILKACQKIVDAQKRFFENGPGYILPLRQKDIAGQIKVHETTISRMANSKYLACEWGIFPIRYFFTNAVAGTNAEPESAENTTNAPVSSVSKEAVKHAIARLLELHKNDKKTPSDQKLADMLAKEGIHIARRTVAKYRAELNIGSSYER